MVVLWYPPVPLIFNLVWPEVSLLAWDLLLWAEFPPCMVVRRKILAFALGMARWTAWLYVACCVSLKTTDRGWSAGGAATCRSSESVVTASTTCRWPGDSWEGLVRLVDNLILSCKISLSFCDIMSNSLSFSSVLVAMVRLKSFIYWRMMSWVLDILNISCLDMSIEKNISLQRGQVHTNAVSASSTSTHEAWNHRMQKRQRIDVPAFVAFRSPSNLHLSVQDFSFFLSFLSAIRV